MWSYDPPLRALRFVLEDLLHAPTRWAHLPPYAEVDAATASQVLQQAGRFASEVLAPLNAVGDREGCVWEAGAVRTPRGFRQAYQAYVQAGWPALACSPAWGGQGLPMALHVALNEMLHGANHAWAMYPGLAHGAYACLLAHGTPELQQRYLPRIVSGQWLATMCLTEAQAGSDLGLVRTRAEPVGVQAGAIDAGGELRVSGSKIFISGGEHDLTDNIVHLVLVRLPDAPAGSRGLSLALVPKILPDGRRNAVHCDGLEHKMGLHGSATCVLRFDAATGWLVGEPHRGLAAMFVMMNAARLLVGVQGLGHLEAARQNAWRYAHERHQSRAPGSRSAAPSAIVEHPAVRRMLWRLEALTQGQRVLALAMALWLDEAEHHPEPALRGRARRLVELLTPVVKAFFTETAHHAVDMALQVWGGHGYLRDHGIEQAVRDSRITMIYEGSNEIQAIDLLQRKLFEDGCHRFAEAMGVIDRELHLAHAAAAELDDGAALRPLAQAVQRQVDALREATARLYIARRDDPSWAYRVADDYLQALGWVWMGWAWLRTARCAAQRRAERWCATQLDAARYGLEWLLPEAGWRLQHVGRRHAVLPAWPPE
ncbi:acyl-CoA dehydrogenase [Caldimonas sp.]|uniref:acyl-CoA dehydrogenase n=1 Tax=Caldimonas sp. TaxID=2838790 RepID=UPI00307EB5BC